MKNIDYYKEETIKSLKNKDLNSAERNFSEFISLIIFSMIISKDCFFGQFMTNILRKTDFKLKAPAAVSIKKGVIIMDLNPIFLVSFDNELIKNIIIHEIYHILNCHIMRSKELQLPLNSFEMNNQNIAMDVAINQLIDGLKDNSNVVTLKNFVEHYVPDKGIYNYYQNPDGVKEKEPFEYYLGIIKDSPKYQEEKKKYEEKQKKLREILKKIEDNGGSLDNLTDEEIHQLLESEEDLSHEIWRQSSSTDTDNMKEIVNQIVSKAAKEAGSMPSTVESIVDRINKKPVIRWQEELKNFIGSVKCPYKLTILRRSRRQPTRFDIKGRLSDRKLNLAVAIDTSSSMSDDDIKFIFNEIFNIVKAVKFKLTIIECDCEINHVYTANNENEITTKVHGRGGTSFTPVFKYIKENKLNPDVLIYFTDGYGEREIDPVYRPNCKVMWVLNEKATDLSVKNPFTNKIKELRISEHSN